MSNCLLRAMNRGPSSVSTAYTVVKVQIGAQVPGTLLWSEALDIDSCLVWGLLLDRRPLSPVPD